tara:strand:- start:111 stop:311 length:201 start_codon:yes stop_codon:yes gene_type:complete
MIGKVRYLNSGDWVESNTGIVENLDGEMKLFSYEEFAENLTLPEIDSVPLRLARCEHSPERVTVRV